jgi:hypothetical protein
MVRIAALLLASAVPALSAETPRISVREISAPAPAAGATASGPSLALGPPGAAWLSWLETQGSETALRYARFDPRAVQWSAAETIASGPDWFVNWADFPALTIGPGGRATAVWFVRNPTAPAPTGAAPSHDHHGPGYHAMIRRSPDGGKTWGAPTALTTESDSVEFVSLVTLADGRVLAAWLDGRAKKQGGAMQQLYARVIDAAGSDVLVDPAVCDCCQTTLTAFPDGTALLAYRGRTAEEVRDIRVTRFRGQAWDEPRTLSGDDWRINACPVNGPQLASDGGRVAAAWFTAADNDPRVLASFSPDAGARFLMPLQVSETKPAGRVATTLLHDGAILVTWVDVAGVLWLRRITPDFSTTDPIALTTAAHGSVKGFPRLALVRDYVGGKEPAQLLVTFTTDTGPALRTLLVTVPEGDLIEAEKNCECAPTPEQLRGFPIRGFITSLNEAAATMTIQHYEVPGIFAESTREFKVPPALFGGAAQPGRQFLGRVEERAGVWWLIEVRLIAGPPR